MHHGCAHRHDCARNRQMAHLRICAIRGALSHSQIVKWLICASAHLHLRICRRRQGSPPRITTSPPSSSPPRGHTSLLLIGGGLGQRHRRARTPAIYSSAARPRSASRARPHRPSDSTLRARRKATVLCLLHGRGSAAPEPQVLSAETGAPESAVARARAHALVDTLPLAALPALVSFIKELANAAVAAEADSDL